LAVFGDGPHPVLGAFLIITLRHDLAIGISVDCRAFQFAVYISDFFKYGSGLGVFFIKTRFYTGNVCRFFGKFTVGIEYLADAVELSILIKLGCHNRGRLTVVVNPLSFILLPDDISFADFVISLIVKCRVSCAWLTAKVARRDHGPRFRVIKKLEDAYFFAVLKSSFVFRTL